MLSIFNVSYFINYLNKRFSKSQFYTAFTLAEVLITLGIIGVVACLTIPSLVNNIQDKELRTSFKKMYTTMSQVTQSLVYENGGSISGEFTDDNSFKNLFAQKLRMVKNCDSDDSSCWTCNGERNADYYLNNKSVYDNSWWWYEKRPTVVLSDGSMINFSYGSSNCSSNDNGIISPYQGSICGSIFVDVNGCKKPNTWGRDIFYIEVQKNKIFTLGPSNDNGGNGLTCDHSSSLYAGLTCGELVLENKNY